MRLTEENEREMETSSSKIWSPV